MNTKDNKKGRKEKARLSLMSSKSSFGGSDDWSDPRDEDSPHSTFDHARTGTSTGTYEYSGATGNNTSFITPPRYISSPSSQSQPTQQQQQQEGVEIPHLLQNLFGLDFLPRNLPGSEETILEEDPSPFQQHTTALTPTPKPKPLTLDFQTDTDYDTSNDEGGIITTTSSTDIKTTTQDSSSKPRQTFRGQRIKHAYGMIKSKVKDAKERRQSWKQRRDSDEVDASLTYINNGHINDTTTYTTPTTTCTDNQRTLQRHKAELEAVLTETKEVRTRADQLATKVKVSQTQIAELERILTQSVNQLQIDTEQLKVVQQTLQSLEGRQSLVVQDILHNIIPNGDHTSTIINTTPFRTPNKRANTSRLANKHTDPTTRNSRQQNTFFHNNIRPRRFTEDCTLIIDDKNNTNNHTNEIPHSRSVDNISRLRSQSTSEIPHNNNNDQEFLTSSFMRVHDLNISNSDKELFSTAAVNTEPTKEKTLLMNIDQDVGNILDALYRFGFQVITDESERFSPAMNTEKILEKSAGRKRDDDDYWPYNESWHILEGSDVAVWQGQPCHLGPGQDLPMVKARGIIQTTPKKLADLLLDSSRVHEYNKMSQGRFDICYFQKGLHTEARNSFYNIPGEAKITKSLNRPPVIRKNLEMMTLTYARTWVNEHCSSSWRGSDSYVIVSRSVYENDCGIAESQKDTVRSEMHLGVNLLRPVAGPTSDSCYCELTTITHVNSCAVPEMLAKLKAPSHAAGFIKEIQSIFVT